MNHNPGVEPESPDSSTKPADSKRPWVRPEVKELPRLTDLTLQTGSPITVGGNTGGGGSTVF